MLRFTDVSARTGSSRSEGLQLHPLAKISCAKMWTSAKRFREFASTGEAHSLKTTIWKFSPVPLKWFRWLFRCTNLWGSYKCHCRPGYRLAADKRSCVDIDECSEYGVSSGSSLGLCIGQVSSLSPAQIFLLARWSLSNKKKKLTAISYFVLLFLGCFESREPIVFQAFRIQGQMAQSWYR